MRTEHQELGEALGLVETRGLVSEMIEAADAMGKAANVVFVGCRKSMPVSSPPSSAATRVGELVAVYVVPRPAAGVETVFPIR